MQTHKNKFPIYRKLLMLYPKSYRRQYKTQMLQLASDMLSEPNGNHMLIWLHILRDYASSLPHEWIAHSQMQFARSPKKYLAKQLIRVVIMLAPVIATVCAMIFNPQLDLLSNKLAAFWFSATGTAIWLKLLPILAVVVTVYTIGIWISTKQFVLRRYKKRRAATILLLTLIVLASSAAVFTGFVTAAQIAASRLIERQKTISLANEAEHPSLACILLPLSTAQRLLGKDAYLLNSGSMNIGYKNYPDEVSEEGNVQSTHCFYSKADFLDIGLMSAVDAPLNKDASAELSKNFFETGIHDGDGITLNGYKGYFALQTDPKNRVATITLLVNEHRLSVTASTFEKSHSAMQVMVENLKKLNTQTH